MEFESAVAAVVEKLHLDPANSAHDFFALCRSLYEFENARLINRPAEDRRGPAWWLNQQIDHYHLSYLPFVDVFVTDDAVLRKTAGSLSQTFRPNVQVCSVQTFLGQWIRSSLTR